MTSGRFVRKSLSFSKSDKMHELCLRLFVHEYNHDALRRYHRYLQRRAAMGYGGYASSAGVIGVGSQPA